ncbi:MAG: hypothetical protein Q9216_004594 [Gyalolechia sp. 2 TL-2023]
MLTAFDEVVNAEEKDVWMIWAHIEGMARFLSQDNWKWYHIDDAEGNGKRVMLIGTAILTAISHLVNAELFTNDSAIRNLGFVLGLLVEFVTESEETCQANEHGWRIVVVQRLDEHAVQVRGTSKMEQIVESVRQEAADEAADDEEEAEEETKDLEKPNSVPNFVKAYKSSSSGDNPDDETFRSWDTWDWKLELSEYTKLHGCDGAIGGNYFDLTIPHSSDEEYGSNEESLSGESLEG